MTTARPLKINWIEGKPSLSGGIKSNRLLAEAMARRGHTVTTCHLPPGRAWPSIRNPRQLWIRAKETIRALREGYRHHLESSTVHLHQFSSKDLDPQQVPDADVTLASWWAVWKEVSGWPVSKGLKVHLIRGYETYSSAPSNQVRDAYRIQSPKVVISSWLEQIMRDEYGHTEVVRVPNGVDRAQFDSPPRAKQPHPTVGMLIGPGHAKNSRLALEAIKLIEREIPNLRVIAFGKRDPDPAWPIPNNFEFHLRPSQDTIPGLYQRCDCWMISSNSEGFGMPGIEAASGHCPIVSTRCGGPSDFVREGENGFLVELGDARALATQTTQVLNLDEARWRSMSDASYRIAQEFDWDRSAEKLESALYRWLDEGR